MTVVADEYGPVVGLHDGADEAVAATVAGAVYFPSATVAEAAVSNVSVSLIFDQDIGISCRG